METRVSVEAEWTCSHDADINDEGDPPSSEEGGQGDSETIMDHVWGLSGGSASRSLRCNRYDILDTLDGTLSLR